MLPSASGAAIERADRISAAFHGAIAPTTPTGWRTPMASVPGLSDGITCADRRVGERRPPGGAGPATKPIWNMPKPNVQPVSRASRPTTSSCRLSRAVGRLQEDALAHGGRRLRPRGKGVGGRLDGARRVGARSRGHTRDDVAGERIEVVERRACRGADPVAADELLRLSDRWLDGGHLRSFQCLLIRSTALIARPDSASSRRLFDLVEVVEGHQPLDREAALDLQSA